MENDENENGDTGIKEVEHRRGNFKKELRRDETKERVRDFISGIKKNVTL